jgi:hypothetical protein
VIHYRAAFFALWAAKVTLVTINAAWATYVTLSPFILAALLFSWSLS